METTRNTRATQGSRTVEIVWHEMFEGRLQSIQMVRDTFTCTDGIQVVRVTHTSRMMIRSIDGRPFQMLWQNQSITWETTDGHSGWKGTMAQAHQIASDSN